MRIDVNQYFKVREIARGVYHITDPLGVCCTLIVGNEKALLFDTGFGIWDLKKTVRALTDQPLIVVNSHGHTDHVFGNIQFDTIYIHKSDIALARDSLASVERKKEQIQEIIDQRIALPEYFHREHYLKSSVVEFISVEEGHVFDLGEKKLEVIHLPGHTLGCIALLDKKDRIILGGDSILPAVWLFFEYSTSIATFIKSLKKVNQNLIDVIVTSHNATPYSIDLIDKLIHCAQNVDLEKSTLFSKPADPNEVHIYSEGGKAYVDSEAISIVFSKDKL